MTEQAQPLGPARVLDVSNRQKQFKSFSCGRKGRPWEVAVNHWAELVYRGKLGAPQTVFAVEDAIGKGLGMISLKPRELEIDGSIVLDLPHVWMFGVDRLHHGRGIGSRLLEALLENVDQDRASAQYVWAYVHPDNEASHSLFQKYGFTRREPAAEGHDAIRLLKRY